MGNARIQPALDASPQIRALEYDLVAAQGLARKLWNALKARKGLEWDAFDVAAFFGADGARAVDIVFEAAQQIWAAHHVFIEPCSRILDGQIEGRDFIGLWPDGSFRNLSRAQVLMMAGMDAEGES